MANRFAGNFFPPRNNGPFQSPIDAMNQFNTFRQNPVKFLADRGINVPSEYANNPEQMGRYLLNNMASTQQNGVIQTANMLRGMFGFK